MEMVNEDKETKGEKQSHVQSAQQQCRQEAKENSTDYSAFDFPQRIAPGRGRWHAAEPGVGVGWGGV